MTNKYAETSILAFSLGSSTVFLKFVCVYIIGFQNISLTTWLFVCSIVGALFITGLYLTVKEKKYFEVAIRGGALGFAFGIGFHLTSSETFMFFGYYFMALTFFHFSEYFTTAVANPKSLTLASFLLDHSREYTMAAVASWVEFMIELYFFPGLKHIHLISIIGLMLVVFGEIVRKGSMFTAKSNFNHYVQYVRRPGHELVTNGVYSWCRHPSYVGWFYWSIGTQLILCNPLCLVAYTVVSWKFFNERIQEEEIYLLNFFGEDYVDYKKNVRTGLPFITGYQGHYS
ncbi:protein-S-isoprenylcysteine O-methyltransferase-like [Mytilus californianus]|uniref:protein-S-isoprenylcysteine O-methyltransferase-like n=1 Tax=Mytilus californianus TaxID=6549 RepID=UPI0022472E13|nr:protein-S-isoprenylcysteine O-methyltransferase-like [Mytilus californianus]